MISDFSVFPVYSLLDVWYQTLSPLSSSGTTPVFLLFIPYTFFTLRPSFLSYLFARYLTRVFKGVSEDTTAMASWDAFLWLHTVVLRYTISNFFHVAIVILYAQQGASYMSFEVTTQNRSFLLLYPAPPMLGRMYLSCLVITAVFLLSLNVNFESSVKPR